MATSATAAQPADPMKLEPEIELLLRFSYRELVVQIPVRMNGGGLERRMVVAWDAVHACSDAKRTPLRIASYVTALHKVS